MQKKLIAMAVAGLVAVPAFAQSNVTIYGRLDAGVFNIDKADGKGVAKVNSSGWTSSRLGFKGSENLGNGLQALFQIETKLVNDDATGLGGTLNDKGEYKGLGRDTFVGLAGGFGAVLLGRISTPLSSWQDDFDATEGANLFQYSNVGDDGISGTTFEARGDNTIAYATPNWGGFQGIAYYSLNLAGQENDANKENTRVGGVGFRYTAGGFDAFYTYNNADKKIEADNHAVGLSYDFGAAKLYAGYIYTDVNKDSKGKEYNKAVNQASVGVSIPVGAGVVAAGYGMETNLGGTKDKDQDIYSVTYKHNLSKRTAIYAGYRRVDPNKGTAQDNYGVGLIHKF